jgi:hypothetical protein
VTRQDNAAEVLGLELIKLLDRADKRRRKLVIRVHDSGDFYSASYQMMWYHIARAFPSVTFYAYTKQVGQSRLIDWDRPANFVLIFSLGGKQDSFVESGLRHSRVFETVQDLEAAGYANASDDDLVAIGTNPKIGLVYHGVKSFQNTRWDKVSALVS